MTIKDHYIYNIEDDDDDVDDVGDDYVGDNDVDDDIGDDDDAAMAQPCRTAVASLLLNNCF